MRYSSENVWTAWLGWKLIMVRDFPLKYLQMFLIAHQFGSSLLSELASICIQNTGIFKVFFILLEQRKHLNMHPANFIFQVFWKLYFWTELL